MTTNQINILQKLTEKQNLTTSEAEELMENIMAGKKSHVEMAALLIALKMKGETKGEIAAFAKVMRENAVKIKPSAELLVDTCGTGGDGAGTFNISTTAAFIAAGAGVKIAKHGNRSVSSKCGSADVLEQLGVKMLQPDEVEKCIDMVGIGFMFAPYFHPATKNVAPVRKELGVKTVFNILGPLTNPAGANAQVIGVYDGRMTRTIVGAAVELGVTRVMAVHSEGMDEIGLGKTIVVEARNGMVEEYELNGKDFGFEMKEVPKVQSKEESAEIICNVLNGKKGAARETSILNAAAAIYVSGLAKSMEHGIELAADSVDSGDAIGKLNCMMKFGGNNAGEKNGHS
jgi:anthranilate phosphoribosyltransferase